MAAGGAESAKCGCVRLKQSRRRVAGHTPRQANSAAFAYADVWRFMYSSIPYGHPSVTVVIDIDHFWTPDRHTSNCAEQSY